ncbi:putative inactive receptor kinase [Acorus calamus]|uniref:Inactive receptor kinase n=1 Tax=Acorus calamus TaxID=4465 RepID=A0AAV9ETU6_ACOCL|nr:putative inactive receptor kinase [Acorus calamus]
MIHTKRSISTFSIPWLICISSLLHSLKLCSGGHPSETAYLLNFIRKVDPANSLGVNQFKFVPRGLTGVKYDPSTKTITEIVLENSNLTGTIDASSLCKLRSLQVLNLARNFIRGSIPDSISDCVSLTHLNLSNNLLEGKIPPSLYSLANLESLNLSNNNLVGRIHSFDQQAYPHREEFDMRDSMTNPSSDPQPPNEDIKTAHHLSPYLFSLLLMLAFFSILAFLVIKNSPTRTEPEELIEFLKESPMKINVMETEKEHKETPTEEKPDLAFFIEEHERFQINDLLSSAADLRGQSFYSSLYKVRLRDDYVFAVKRLKNLQVLIDDFKKEMMRVGHLRHPNLLPLVAYHCTESEKLLIYRYQRKGSLLSLLISYAEGKREFPWRLRLHIASGIAQGLRYLLESNVETIPHGNLKPSNILLTESDNPLISEYGIQSFIDRKKPLAFSSNGYRAPEKALTEKSDIYSFGVVLLELLTGKTVERTGLDLPKWVKAMVREEWTGEVFDREVNRAGRQWAFPLLNVALQCVSNAPEARPDIYEVLVKIEQVMSTQDDDCISSPSSVESTPRDNSLLHTAIPENTETP